MKSGIATILLLIISNVFMTLAWYGNLKLSSTGLIKSWPLWCIILLSWGLAFLEYCFMIPANRMGFNGNGGPYSLFQLKIIQEAISLTVFTIIAVMLFQGEKLQWNYFVSFLCLVAAVVFAFLPQK